MSAPACLDSSAALICRACLRVRTCTHHCQLIIPETSNGIIHHKGNGNIDDDKVVLLAFPALCGQNTRRKVLVILGLSVFSYTL